MQLQLSTWPEVEDYLERSTGIIIPIGSTEQHGPNGFIGTDALCPEVIARGVGDKDGVLVAPTVGIGMAQHHLGFPGSITLRPTTLIALLTDIIRSLERHGFERFYFLNGHGGNVATVTAAFSEIYAEASFEREAGNRSGLRCKLSNWYMAPSARRLSQQLFGGSEGSHATPSEISLTYYAYPEHVKQAEMSPRIAPTGPIRDAHDYRRRFSDGRIGSDPSLASVEAGKRLYEGVVADVSQEFASFLREN